MSTLTCRDRAKCSITSSNRCVNCSRDSSGVEIGVGRAGDGAGETGRSGETGHARGVVGTNRLMAVAAVASSSEVVMVMAVAVVVVSKGLDALHMHSH